jgi:hypothetical protein
MEIKLVRRSPLVTLPAGVFGAAFGVIVAKLMFADPSVLLGARVLFGLAGFMIAYAIATWVVSQSDH